MPSWNSSAVHNGKLHTNSRRRQSSTPAIRQSAEDDRSAVSNGQLWSSVFCCCGPSTWNSLPDSLRDQALSLSIFHASPENTLFCEILTRLTQRVKEVYENALYKFTFYLLTYLLTYLQTRHTSVVITGTHVLNHNHLLICVLV